MKNASYKICNCNFNRTKTSKITKNLDNRIILKIYYIG